MLSCVVAVQGILSRTALQGLIPLALGAREGAPAPLAKVALVVLTGLAAARVASLGARRSDAIAAGIYAFTGLAALPLLWLACLIRPGTRGPAA